MMGWEEAPPWPARSKHALRWAVCQGNLRRIVLPSNTSENVLRSLFFAKGGNSGILPAIFGFNQGKEIPEMARLAVVASLLLIK